jgi:hypothetical protein
MANFSGSVRARPIPRVGIDCSSKRDALDSDMSDIYKFTRAAAEIIRNQYAFQVVRALSPKSRRKPRVASRTPRGGNEL